MISIIPLNNIGWLLGHLFGFFALKQWVLCWLVKRYVVALLSDWGLPTSELTPVGRFTGISLVTSFKFAKSPTARTMNLCLCVRCYCNWMKLIYMFVTHGLHLICYHYHGYLKRKPMPKCEKHYLSYSSYSLFNTDIKYVQIFLGMHT